MDFRLIDNSGEEFGTIANVDSLSDEGLLEQCKSLIADAVEAEHEGDEIES
jgi:hypothetical protein